MTPELQNTLAVLAQKLGTSVDHLWPLLVAKTKLDAGITIFSCGIGGVISTIVALWCLKRLSEIRDRFDDDKIIYTLAIVFAVVAAILFYSFSIGSISDFVYPEPSAIQSLLHH